jgi:hypothetical protein
MEAHEWRPTEGLAAEQQGPNFFICRGFEDGNFNGQLDPEEIQGMNPAQVGSGEKVNFVVRNPSSWKLKAQVELHDKDQGRMIYRSDVGAIAAGESWILNTELPKVAQATNVQAEFYVDFSLAEKRAFTLVP